MQQFLEDRRVPQEKSRKGEVPRVPCEGLYGTKDTNHSGAFEGDEGGLLGCHWFISAVP